MSTLHWEIMIHRVKHLTHVNEHIRLDNQPFTNRKTLRDEYKEANELLDAANTRRHEPKRELERVEALTDCAVEAKAAISQVAEQNNIDLDEQ